MKNAALLWAIAVAGHLTADATAQAPSTGSAQVFPVKSIRIIAPFPPASVADVLARPVAQKMNEAWGQPVIVDNRTGAAGNVGAELVAKAAPDGYTLLLGTIGTNAINAVLYAKMPYNARTDFAPITLVANAPLFLVMHPSVPVKTVKDVVALAKARPSQLNYGSAGMGTSPHLAGEMFQHLAGVKMTLVTYKGSPQSAIDLVAGRLDLIFANGSAVLPLIRTGRLRLIATSGVKRDPAMPTYQPSAKPLPASSSCRGGDCLPRPGRRVRSWRNSTAKRCASSHCRTSRRNTPTSASPPSPIRRSN
jgi:tripartite-type tricarboxylate transporter receptor subunit TctC